MSEIFKLFSSGGTSSVLYGVLGTLAVAFLALFYFYQSAVAEMRELEISLQLERANTQELRGALEKQNRAILDLKVEKRAVNVEPLRAIKVESHECAAELKAYKALFKELGK